MRAAISRMLAVLLLSLPICVAAESPSRTTIRGKVVDTVDGDTIHVLDGKTRTKVRLEGIDAPEAGQPFGTKAKHELSTRIFGKEVLVRATGKDKYGRTLGVVWLNDRNINSEMVADGFAWHFKKYSKDGDLADAELLAREKKRGLWADPDPIAPWDWRATEAERRAEKPTSGKTASTPLTRPESKPNRSTPAPKKAAPDVEEATVFITNTGKKYHSAGCSYLAKSKIPISLSDAEQQGYTACSKCGGSAVASRPRDNSVSSSAGETTATGKEIHTGPRGGRYHFSKSGKKVYERK